jgi:hypothetical protein
VELWTAKYGKCFPWNDGLVLHRWRKTDRDKVSGIVTEEVQMMGVLIQHGEWENIA